MEHEYTSLGNKLTTLALNNPIQRMHYLFWYHTGRIHEVQWQLYPPNTPI